MSLLWLFHASVMESARTLTPHQVWATRMDEAARLCGARAALLRRAQAGSGGSQSNQSEDWKTNADGSRTRTISSMDGLRNLLRNGTR